MQRTMKYEMKYVDYIDMKSKVDEEYQQKLESLEEEHRKNLEAVERVWALCNQSADSGCCASKPTPKPAPKSASGPAGKFTANQFMDETEANGHAKPAPKRERPSWRARRQKKQHLVQEAATAMKGVYTVRDLIDTLAATNPGVKFTRQHVYQAMDNLMKEGQVKVVFRGGRRNPNRYSNR